VDGLILVAVDSSIFFYETPADTTTSRRGRLDYYLVGVNFFDVHPCRIRVVSILSLVAVELVRLDV